MKRVFLIQGQLAVIHILQAHSELESCFLGGLRRKTEARGIGRECKSLALGNHREFRILL